VLQLDQRERERRTDFALLIVGVLFLTMLPRVSQAASSSCGAQGNYFDGVNGLGDFSADADGVQSDIEARYPALCTGTATRFVLGTALIGSDQPSDINGWAQIGWILDTDLCCLRFFWQWAKDRPQTPLRTAFWGNPELYTRYNFKVTRLATDGHLHMLYLDPDIAPPCNQAGICPETSFDPHDAWPGFQDAQVFGEVSHPGMDMPGIDSNRADFAAILSRRPGGPWENPDAWTPGNDRPCYWKWLDVSTPTYFRTWTDPFTHGTSC
jgi:hypothetical protein